jgi:hypothetical protein
VSYQILHKKSDELYRIPSANTLNYGEIAINYAKGGEMISLKNNENEIKSFRPIIWDNTDKNLNDYIIPGVYHLYGKRINQNDNLPTLEVGDDVIIDGILIITQSLIDSTTTIGQTLILTDSAANKTQLYSRALLYGEEWGNWSIVGGDIDNITEHINTIEEIVAISLTDLNERISCIPILFTDLREKADEGMLVPNQRYRIIDYVTLTYQLSTQSACHPYDIIVTAIDEYRIDEKAQACYHTYNAEIDGDLNDNYFEHYNVPIHKWQIWFSINIKDKYSWIIPNNSKFSYIKPIAIKYVSENTNDVTYCMDGNNEYYTRYINLIDKKSDSIYDWEFFNVNYADGFHTPYMGELFKIYPNEEITQIGDKNYLVLSNKDAEFSLYVSYDGAMSNEEGFYSKEIKTWLEGKFRNPNGVIYRMIDEWGNDCPYDFKNILTNIDNNITKPYYFTFTKQEEEIIKDSTIITHQCGNNVIKPYINDNVQILNEIIFFNSETYNNIIEDNNYKNRFYGITYNNVIKQNFADNSIQSSFYNNKINDDCSSNIFSGDFILNEIDSNCQGNNFSTTPTRNCNFGYSFTNNTFSSTTSSGVTDAVNNCDFGNNISFVKDFPLSMANVYFTNNTLPFEKKLSELLTKDGDNILDRIINKKEYEHYYILKESNNIYTIFIPNKSNEFFTIISEKPILPPSQNCMRLNVSDSKLYVGDGKNKKWYTIDLSTMSPNVLSLLFMNNDTVLINDNMLGISEVNASIDDNTLELNDVSLENNN